VPLGVRQPQPRCPELAPDMAMVQMVAPTRRLARRPAVIPISPGMWTMIPWSVRVVSVQWLIEDSLIALDSFTKMRWRSRASRMIRAGISSPRCSVSSRVLAGKTKTSRDLEKQALHWIKLEREDCLMDNWSNWVMLYLTCYWISALSSKHLAVRCTEHFSLIGGECPANEGSSVTMELPLPHWHQLQMF